MLVYTVTLEVPDEALAAEILAWLEDDHAGEVVEAGARSAEVTRLDADGPDAPIVFACRYEFDSREAFQRYERGPAERLRAEGRARFPAERGVVMRRTVREVLLRRPDGSRP